MKQSYTILTSLFVLSIMTVLSVAEEAARLTDSRIWHGKNGKHFRGQFMGRDGDIIRVANTQGKIFKIPLTSLSADDQKWFSKVWAKKEKAENHIDVLVKPGVVSLLDDCKIPKVAPIGYRRTLDTQITRLNIPSIDQGEYHDKDFNNYASSLVPFFVWWNNYKVIDVPARRDDNEKRIEWLYTNLNELDFRRRSGFRVDELQKFCQQELKTKHSFQVIDLCDGRKVHHHLKELDRFSPKFLSQYTKGANATLLAMCVYKNGRYEWTAEVPLIECKPTGEVLFYMFGDIKMQGKLEKLPFDAKEAKKRGDRLARYEIKVANMGDAPDWFQAREYTFFLEGAKETGLVVIVPNTAEKLDDEDAEDKK